LLPILVDIWEGLAKRKMEGLRLTKGIGCIVSPEVLEERVLDEANSATSTRVRLDHQHLGALVDVDVAHSDIRDCSRLST
jgi:hypothetical protein